MKQKLTLRNIIGTITSVLLAVYSAYNVFVVARDVKRGLSLTGIIISIIIAISFAVLAFFVQSAAMNTKDLRLLIVRRTAFIIALFLIFALKLRMAGKVIAYLDFSKLHTVLYGSAYLTTQFGLLLLLIYYIFILKMLPFFPRAAVAFPLAAMLLFFSSLVIEAVMFFVYGIGLEANLIRTVVMRPVFYLGLMGLSVYFLFPPQIEE